MAPWNPEQTIGNLIDHQTVAFISSVDDEGYPNLKAMLAPRRREGLAQFWFTTNTSSMRVDQYRANPLAAVYFMDRRFMRGVMIRGRMTVLEDTASKEMIWEAGDTKYYLLGVSDPDYCVLHFAAKDGRYFVNFKSKTFQIDAPGN